MVDTTLPGLGTARSFYRVRRLTDRETIRMTLLGERAYAAYGLAQLAPSMFPRSEWWHADSDRGRALVMHARAGLGPAMLAIGEPGALDASLGLHPGPRATFATFKPEHLGVMERYYFMSRKTLMVRMSVTAEMFRPAAGTAVRLRGPDIGQANWLYSAEGGPAAYSPRHLEEGMYYGVVVNGRLASIAGTHVVAPTERVAVVGNVFTHPRYRGQGLATVATSAVTAALLQLCDSVALTVETTNEPALAVYRRLGYQEDCQVYETPALRKDTLGIASLARRLAAHWRGRQEGKEIVVR